MRTAIYPQGSLVLITSFGPYGGCIGTVRQVYIIDSEGSESVPFYLIELHEGQAKEPVWFEHNVVVAALGHSTFSLAQDEIEEEVEAST